MAVESVPHSAADWAVVSADPSDGVSVALLDQRLVFASYSEKSLTPKIVRPPDQKHTSINYIPQLLLIF